MTSTIIDVVFDGDDDPVEVVVESEPIEVLVDRAIMFSGPSTTGMAGPPGPPGADGVAGADGQDGADGADGQDGPAGADGDSAYQVAVANGFVGNELAWLASLVGEAGADGAAGQDGQDGLDGPAGDSAYEVAVDEGFVGTVQDWLDSLQTDAQLYVDSQITALIGGASAAFDTLLELETALGDAGDDIAALVSSIAGKQALHANLTALSGLAGASGKVPFFTGTGAMSMFDSTIFGQSVVAAADAAALRVLAGTVIGTHVEPAGSVATHSADTTAVHGIADTANLILEGDARLTNARTPTAHKTSHEDGGADELALDGTQITSGLVADARIAASIARDSEVTAAISALSSVYQPLDGDLSAIAVLTSAADKMLYATGAGTWALTDLTATGRSILDDTSVGAVRTTIGLDSDDTVQHGQLGLGAAITAAENLIRADSTGITQSTDATIPMVKIYDRKHYSANQTSNGDNASSLFIDAAPQPQAGVTLNNWTAVNINTQADDSIATSSITNLDGLTLHHNHGVRATTLARGIYCHVGSLAAAATLVSAIGIDIDCGVDLLGGGGNAAIGAVGLRINSVKATFPIGIQQKGLTTHNNFQGHLCIGSTSESTLAQMGLELRNTDGSGGIKFLEQTSAAPSAAASSECILYMKADKLVIKYLDGATLRYKSLDLTGTGVTWVHSTTAP